MTRLIDADALKKAIAEFHQKENERLHTPLWGSIGLNALYIIIDNAPTVPQLDFKEGYKQAIRDGKTNFLRPKSEWEIVDAESGKIWNCVCTECGHDPQEYIGGTEDWWLRKPLPNFCPHCGARIVNVRGGRQ